MNLRNQLKTIETYGKIIASFPEYAALPIYLGESDPEGCAGCPATLDPERDYRRTSQFAAYTAASFMRKQDLLARTGGNLQGAVSWAFTFHDQPWFNGLRALTTNEVALPVFNAFKLFASLQPGQRVRVSNPGMIPTDEILTDGVRGRSDIGSIATKNAVLLWNYHDVAGAGDQATVQLTFEQESASQALWIIAVRIDARHANAYTLWQEMGEPQSPTTAQIKALHTAAELSVEDVPFTENKTGQTTFPLTLEPQSVLLLIPQFLPPIAISHPLTRK